MADSVNNSDDQYRYLRTGELINIGDEFQEGEHWIRITEQEYRQWGASYSTYDPKIMSQMRRLKTPNIDDIAKTKRIRAEFIAGC